MKVRCVYPEFPREGGWPGLTDGKVYEVINPVGHSPRATAIVDDNGFVRHIGTEGGLSAHMWDQVNWDDQCVGRFAPVPEDDR